MSNGINGPASSSLPREIALMSGNADASLDALVGVPFGRRPGWGVAGNADRRRGVFGELFMTACCDDCVLFPKSRDAVFEKLEQPRVSDARSLECRLYFVSTTKPRDPAQAPVMCIVGDILCDAGLFVVAFQRLKLQHVPRLNTASDVDRHQRCNLGLGVYKTSDLVRSQPFFAKIHGTIHIQHESL